ncbi:MAG: glycosyltransferase family 2 protein [Acidobacteriota bacterium]
MTVTLIITTYNRKDALELSLSSAIRQNTPPDEIIIADDGSRTDTAETIRRIASKTSIPVLHVHQKDKGFRVARIRNKALARASGTYIVMADGDMILHPDFVGDHKRAARPAFFSQGSRVLLMPDKTLHTLEAKQIDFSPFESGLRNRHNAVHFPLLSLVLPRGRKGLKGIRTCNFSFWKSDAMAVNGFNEDFEGWGREDSEFAARLMNSGISRQDLRFRAIAYHLYHPEASRDALSRNDSLLENTVRSGHTWCKNGINGHWSPGHEG